MRTTYVHIGMQKTGSKAFQKLIMDNGPRLKEAKLYWPKSPLKGSWHRDLFEASDVSVFSTLQTEIDPEFSPILSYEAGYIAPDFIIDELATVGRLRPLIFIRDAIDWLNSFYNQLIKAHRVPWKQIANFNIDQDAIINWLNVEVHLERWALRCKSPSDLLAVRFDHGVDLPKVFCDWTKCSVEPTREAANRNPAADIRSLRILSRIKQEMEGSSEEDLVQAIELAHGCLKQFWIDTRISPAPMFISENEQMALRDRYESSFQRVLAKYGGEQKSPFEFSVRPQTANRNDLSTCNEIEMKTVREIVDGAHRGAWGRKA